MCTYSWGYAVRPSLERLIVGVGEQLTLSDFKMVRARQIGLHEEQAGRARATETKSL